MQHSILDRGKKSLPRHHFSGRSSLGKHATDLSELLSKMLGKTVNVEEGKFSALVGAFAQNGVVLYVPKGVTVDEPLHSVLWGPGSDLAHVSHILVLVEEGASGDVRPRVRVA